MWAVLREAFVRKQIMITKGASFHFIGSHPMAGSEKSGMEHASIELLKRLLVSSLLTSTQMHSP